MVHLPYRGRFAPTPSGTLHFGSLRTALVAWLDAKAHGGSCFLRIDDLDTTRSRQIEIDRQVHDLSMLGLTLDPYPAPGGRPYYRQSEAGPVYEAAFRELRGQMFACRCSRSELQRLRQQLGLGPDAYPGTCRDQPPGPPPQGVQARRAGGAPEPAVVAWRWVAPEPSYSWEDRYAGTVTVDVATQFGPFVVKRADGHWGYPLASAVDDAVMGISHVVRGDDLLRATGPQIALLQALGHRPPRYAHVPLVLGADGRKLSKSQGATDLAALLGMGLTRESILGLLAASLGIGSRGQTIDSPGSLVADFDLRRIPSEPFIFDPSLAQNRRS